MSKVVTDVLAVDEVSAFAGPTILMLGLYNKIVEVLGSEQREGDAGVSY